MIRDRLEELKQETQLDHASSSDSLCIISEDELVEYVREGGNEVESEFVIIPLKPAIEALLKVYSEILREFHIITNNLEIMKDMIAAKNAKSFNEKEFFKTRQSSIQTGNNIMGQFQILETNLPKQNDFSTLARMKRILYYGLFQKYVEIWTETEQFLQNYEANTRKTLKTQSKILNIELNEEEIEALVSNKQTNLYACNILEDTEHARKTLDALTARLGDLKKLEKSLAEVHSMFIELQRMVVEQSVVMQSIEKHFLDAENYVEEAVEDIKHAEELHKKGVKFFNMFSMFNSKKKVITEMAKETNSVPVI
ncbi:syntaxin-4 isoform X2 [Stomoxys calcitrans]|uniref:t-SNARE coiled-coil homology domain-containing protein n=1 Tax=Stomoxys calcitrans TaxID=35570 RepID=A0A1I8QF44_STOCA|nr:syntaxin-4 isoform X2 [Stomoxys calcitrans]